MFLGVIAITNCPNRPVTVIVCCHHFGGSRNVEYRLVKKKTSQMMTVPACCARNTTRNAIVHRPKQSMQRAYARSISASAAAYSPAVTTLWHLMACSLRLDGAHLLHCHSNAFLPSRRKHDLRLRSIRRLLAYERICYCILRLVRLHSPVCRPHSPRLMRPMDQRCTDHYVAQHGNSVVPPQPLCYSRQRSRVWWKQGLCSAYYSHRRCSNRRARSGGSEGFSSRARQGK
jgi:hypothetical protein